jgi:3',5'-nucleoside bisphosphate phosphatase
VGVRVVAGCEFSVEAPWGEAHVLGYFLSADDLPLQRFLDDTRRARRERAMTMVRRLQDLGTRIDVEDVLVEAGAGAVGRPHVARALVRRGAVGGVGEAFSRFIGRGKPAFVEKPLPAFATVADLAHRAGGVVVAAHFADQGTENSVRPFVAQGMDGLEVRHPSHDKATERRLTALAKKLGLAITGGSDWHGDSAWRADRASLGGLNVPEEWLEQLETRKGAR